MTAPGMVVSGGFGAGAPVTAPSMVISGGFGAQVWS